MSFVTVFCWPAYLKTSGSDPSVLRLVQLYGPNKAVYRRDAGDWTLTVQHDDKGAITTMRTTYETELGERVLTPGGEPMYPATWEEHEASNEKWAQCCDCARIQLPHD